MDQNEILQNLQKLEEPETKSNTSEVEGKLNVDITQNNEKIYILAPISGVTMENINISITEDVLRIEGSRIKPDIENDLEPLTEECFWGKFSRSIILPENCNTEKVEAKFKDGILSISIEKIEPKERTQNISIHN